MESPDGVARRRRLKERLAWCAAFFTSLIPGLTWGGNDFAPGFPRTPGRAGPTHALPGPSPPGSRPWKMHLPGAAGAHCGAAFCLAFAGSGMCCLS